MDNHIPNKKKILIVVDAQNDFIDGCLGSENAVAVIPNIKKKIEEYVNMGELGEIIFTQDTHYENYLDTLEGKNLPIKHCIVNTEGWKVSSELDIPNRPHVLKETFGWNAWGFKLDSTEVESVELVGFCTDICVVTNALLIKTLFPHIEISVDASCCAGVTPESHQAALTTMKMCQINVKGE